MNDKVSAEDSISRGIKHCPVCDGENFVKMFQVNGHQDFDSNFFKCRDCMAVFLNPCPTDMFLEDFYNHRYYSDEHRKKMGWETDLTKISSEILLQMEKRMNFVESFINEELKYPRGNILDVGCSTGFFLLEAKLRHWNAQGIEISDRAATIAREHLQLPVKTGVLTENDFENESFDVVTAWDVIEHISEPKNFLVNIYRLLKKGGILVFNTPNINSSAAGLSGKAWRHLDPPLHLVLFDFLSIRILLKRYNFKCLEVSSGNEYLGQMQVVAQKIEAK